MQEKCPICNYCKLVDEICTKCRLYINQELTPTEECKVCGEQKLKASVCCFHDHQMISAIKELINPCKEIVQSYSCAVTFPNSFVFFDPGLAEKEEILKISKEGFWVRGVKVEQGENEAKEVYEAFMKLLGYKQ